MILEFKPSDSNITTRYYVVNLDRSKAVGERCLDNDECQSSECYLRLCTFSTILNEAQSVQLFSLIGEFLNSELTRFWHYLIKAVFQTNKAFRNPSS